MRSEAQVRGREWARIAGATIGLAVALLVGVTAAAADVRTDAIKTFIALKQDVLSGASYEDFRKAAVETKTACELAAATAKPALRKTEKHSCDALAGLLEAGLAIFRHRFEDCPSPGLCTDYYPLYREVDMATVGQEDKPAVQKQRDFLDIVLGTMPDLFKPATEGGLLDVSQDPLRSGKPVIHHAAAVAALYVRIAAQCDQAVSAFSR
jgi:hypothetical protein